MRSRALCSCFAILALWLIPITAHATVITLDLGTEFSGAVMPAGPAPWVTATFDDSFGGANNVRLTLSNVGLTGSENNFEIYFNFDPSLDPTLLNFIPINTVQSTPNSISTGVDSFMANGDGNFDILFDMPPPPGNFSSKFTAGETIIYDLNYVSPINVASFFFLSVSGGGQGNYIAAAQIGGIGPQGNDSGFIGAPIPEPSTMLLLGFGLVGMTALPRHLVRRRGLRAAATEARSRVCTR